LTLSGYSKMDKYAVFVVRQIYLLRRRRRRRRENILPNT